MAEIHMMGKHGRELEKMIENLCVGRTNFIHAFFQDMFYQPLPTGDLKLVLPFQKAVKLGVRRHL